MFRTDDGGRSWRPSGLEGQRVTALAVSPADGAAWAGCEPSRVWRSPDEGASWEEASNPATLPSSDDWAFPPRPSTHHVRWIGCHPERPDRLWVAVEAGALIATDDGGRSWTDRVPGSPRDTHELALHPDHPDRLHVAAGDGAFRSPDGGRSWERRERGLDIGYMRSVAIDPGDPDAVLISGASGPRSAYRAGASDGRVYRSSGDRWTPIGDPWGDPPSTIAPLLRGGSEAGELWAADERGVHGSRDGGRTWTIVAELDPRPRYLADFRVSP